MHDFSLPRVESQAENAAWIRILKALRDKIPLVEPHSTSLDLIFAPLAGSTHSDVIIIGQLGQSLDGRIATVTGHSHYINGLQARVHLHRLRAWADAVVVGVGTILSDDPKLTVRHVLGSSPVRVIIDPRGKIPSDSQCLRDNSVKRIILRASTAPEDIEQINEAEVIVVPSESSRISPSTILQALKKRGFKRILVEGGSITLSHFLAERTLDRLHILAAPILIGSGLPGLDLPVVRSIDQALRPRVRAFAFEDGDILFDCAFDQPTR